MLRPLTEAAAELPAAPAVYFLRDFEQNIIYIGAADDVRRQIMHHLSPAESNPVLVGGIDHFTYVPCATWSAAKIQERVALDDFRAAFGDDPIGNQQSGLLLAVQGC
jgi:excinuclease UvrABC nuclease subunit